MRRRASLYVRVGHGVGLGGALHTAAHRLEAPATSARAPPSPAWPWPSPWPPPPPPPRPPPPRPPPPRRSPTARPPPRPPPSWRWPPPSQPASRGRFCADGAVGQVNLSSPSSVSIWRRVAPACLPTAVFEASGRGGGGRGRGGGHKHFTRRAPRPTCGRTASGRRGRRPSSAPCGSSSGRSRRMGSRSRRACTRPGWTCR